MLATVIDLNQHFTFKNKDLRKKGPAGKRIGWEYIAICKHCGEKHSEKLRIPSQWAKNTIRKLMGSPHKNVIKPAMQEKKTALRDWCSSHLANSHTV